MIIAADNVPGPGQGRWTYKEYAVLPNDGHRYEIVDGVLYMTPSPTEWHQTVAGRIFRLLAAHVEDNGLGRVYIAPLDVELAPYVVVQSDIFVILNENRDRITMSRIIGAPDMVVEVTSPGTAAYDRREKQDAYARAGVPEYWIVDPAAQTLDVFVLSTGTYRSLGVFEGSTVFPSQILPSLAIKVEKFVG